MREEGIKVEKFQEADGWHLEALIIPCLSLPLLGGTSVSPEWVKKPKTILHEVVVREAQHLT